MLEFFLKRLIRNSEHSMWSLSLFLIGVLITSTLTFALPSSLDVPSISSIDTLSSSGAIKEAAAQEGDEEETPTTTTEPATEENTNDNNNDNNNPPTADAGPDMTVDEGTLGVTLSGSGQDEDSNDDLNYLWKQIVQEGEEQPSEVELSNADTPQATFDAPNNIERDTTLMFELTVSDGKGEESKDTVNVLVKDVVAATDPAATQVTETGQDEEGGQENQNPENSDMQPSSDSEQLEDNNTDPSTTTTTAPTTGEGNSNSTPSNPSADNANRMSGFSGVKDEPADEANTQPVMTSTANGEVNAIASITYSRVYDVSFGCGTEGSYSQIREDVITGQAHLIIKQGSISTSSDSPTGVHNFRYGESNPCPIDERQDFTCSGGGSPAAQIYASGSYDYPDKTVNRIQRFAVEEVLIDDFPTVGCASGDHSWSSDPFHPIERMVYDSSVNTNTEFLLKQDEPTSLDLTKTRIERDALGRTIGTTTWRLYVTIDPIPKDFSLSCNPIPNPVKAGDTAQTTCTIASIEGGFSEPVNLSCESIDRPSITCGLTPGTVTPPANGAVSSSLVASVDVDTPSGTYNLKVTGTSGDITHSTTVAITVVEPPESEFAISYAAFIPANYVPAPPQFWCFDSNNKRTELYLDGDDRGFDPNSQDYRLKQLVNVVTGASDADGIKDGTTPQNLVGVSEAYAPNAVADGKLDESDDDGVLGDCHLLHLRDQASNENMHITVNKISDNTVVVNMHGGAGLPFKPKHFGSPAPEINWEYTITIDTSGEHPTCRIEGQHDGFPAYEVYINGKRIYEYWPGDPPYGFGHVRALFPPMDIEFQRTCTL